MPTPTITVEYTKAIAGPDQYVVEAKVIDATHIELDIFVFNVESQRYVNVATPYDMQRWPASRAQALEQGLTQFRARGVVHTEATPQLADYFLDVTKSRITTLQSEWELILGAFPGSDIVLVPPTE